MIFNSIQFLWLFPIIFGLYYLVNSVSERFHLVKSSSGIGNLFPNSNTVALYLNGMRDVH